MCNIEEKNGAERIILIQCVNEREGITINSTLAVKHRKLKLDEKYNWRKWFNKYFLNYIYSD
jgi:hypothetical protein